MRTDFYRRERLALVWNKTVKIEDFEEESTGRSCLNLEGLLMFFTIKTSEKVARAALSFNELVGNFLRCTDVSIMYCFENVKS